MGRIKPETLLKDRFSFIHETVQLKREQLMNRQGAIRLIQKTSSAHSPFFKDERTLIGELASCHRQHIGLDLPLIVGLSDQPWERKGANLNLSLFPIDPSCYIFSYSEMGSGDLS